jgi:hypothetical protein
VVALFLQTVRASVDRMAITAAKILFLMSLGIAAFALGASLDMIPIVPFPEIWIMTSAYILLAVSRLTGES